jgi:GT2 family glycosyltransferase
MIFRLSIIIINYKTPELTRKCIEKIFTDPGIRDYEIIVVDNDSGDNSKEHILDPFPEVNWIENSENSGFGRANNLGAQMATGDYLLFLNSDVFVEANTIAICLKEMKSNSMIGALGCTLRNPDGTSQKSQFYHVGTYSGIMKDNLILSKFFRFDGKELQGLMGAFLMIPSALYHELKGFDPDFFMYSEELELCHRIRKRGYRLAYTDNTFALHEHGASSSPDWSLKQNLLSNALLHLKIKGFFGYGLYHLLFQFNILTNMMVLWYFDSTIRRHYKNLYKCYLSNGWSYFVIPFQYKKKYGSGKRSLKRA